MSRLRDGLAAGRPVLRSAGAKLIALPLSVLLTLVSTRLIVERTDSVQFGAVLLVANLASLIPFADLGIGAPVMTKVASSADVKSDRDLANVLRAALRTLTLAGFGLAFVSILMLITGIWPYVLGAEAIKTPNIAIAATLDLVIVAASLPFGLGQRVLTGMGRNHTVVLGSLAAPVVGTLLTAAAFGTRLPAAAFALTMPLGMFASNILTLALAAKLSKLPLWKYARSSLRSINIPATRLRKQAGPMLVLSVATALSLQADRLILSHRSTAAALTQYALVFQIYAPGLGFAFTAATALWPMAVKHQRNSLSMRGFYTKALAGFTVLGTGLAAQVIFAGPLIVTLVTGSAISIPFHVFLFFGLLLFVQVITLPSMMILTSTEALVVQARLAVVGALGNVTVSWMLASRLGASGPVVASLFFGLIFQFLPLGLIARDYPGSLVRARSPLMGGRKGGPRH